jgi:esterase/lipase superfamily enzyme
MEIEKIGKCILVLAADPRGTDRLELEREAATIWKELQAGVSGRDYEVRIEQGTGIEDVAGYLREYQPTIVHIVGHGSATGEILLQDDRNQTQPLTPLAFAELFNTVKNSIECVILNSCFSLEMADELVQHIRCTIGIDEEIDGRSPTFIGEFYREIGAGKGYYQAFECGRNHIESDLDAPSFISRDRTIFEIQANDRQDFQGQIEWHQDSPLELPVAPSTILAAGVTDNLDTEQKISAPSTILYPLWYGTNRKPIDPNNISKGFSGNLDDQIHYGACQVPVPKCHKIGAFDADWLTSTDDRLTLDRTSLQAMMGDSFWANIQAVLQQLNSAERMGLVFIHGFNVSFEEAALTAAQIGSDLGLPGLTAFYSWPSQGRLTSYGADEANIQASTDRIAKFLTDFVTKSNADRIHIIAHSMGNRGLLRSLQQIVTKFQGQSKVPFGQIFLAAPDEDTHVLSNLGVTYQSLAEQTTLYTSDKHKARFTPTFVPQSPRGSAPPITLIPGIDTIDVSGIDLSLLGHGYYHEARPLLEDIYDSIVDGTAPNRRFGLRAVETEAQRYWQIRK